MQDLMAYLPAILALGLAVILRLRTVRREASENPELTARLQLFAQHEREMDKACKRLNAMKAELTFEYTVEEKYVAELNSIVMSLEKATGRDLSRWLGMSSQEKQAGVWSHDRDFFRLRILSLLAFCTYQSYHPHLPPISPTRVSRLVH